MHWTFGGTNPRFEVVHAMFFHWIPLKRTESNAK